MKWKRTILPNGKVLVDGGSAKDEDATTASLKAEIYDPATNSFSSAGSNTFPRLYHNTQLLLPDATVALTGGNPEQGVFENHIEIYQPSYLFNSDGSAATRPIIGAGTPGSISYGQSFTVPTPDAANIASVVLMKAGSVTHSFDMDQRYVGLTLRSRTGCGEFEHAYGDRPAGFEHRSSRLLHAFPGEQGWHAVDCELGAGFRCGCSGCQS